MFRQTIHQYIQKIKALNGDPHYIALGMAIGVFIAITPTIPFHTAIAIGLAFLLKASKPAAILGVWVSNPFTVVFLYFACYKTGYLFFDVGAGTLNLVEELIEHLESDIKFSEKITYLTEFIKVQFEVFLIMNFGGLILGLPAGGAAYFISRIFFTRFRERRQARKKRI